MQKILDYSEAIKEIPALARTPETRMNVTSVGWITNDNKTYIDSYNTSCHASFKNNIKVNNPTYAWNGFHNAKKDKDYLKWITDETLSPWKTVLSNSILILKNDIIDSILINSEHNGFIACNLFIGARIATEHNEGKIWNDFIQEGIHPSLACLFTVYLEKSGTSWVYRDRSNWHRPFNSGQLSLKRFLSSNPLNKPNSSIKEGGYNNLCNYIWDKGELNSDIKVFFKNNKDYKSKSRYDCSPYDAPVSKVIESYDQLREFQTYLLDKYKD